MLKSDHRSIMFRQFFLALVIGLAAGFVRVSLAYQVAPLLGNGAGDFTFATRIARDVWNGHDPYEYPIGPDSVSYPLPAGLIALPFSIFPDEIASGIFIGVSSFILAWCLLKTGKTWSLLIFLSLPFAYAVLFAQWTPLIACIWFLPVMMPLILVKPHIALPLIITGRVSKKGLMIAFLLLIISLLIYPTWPAVWLAQTRTYRGLPPLFSLPLGPIILFALLKYRERRAWLLLLLALMPQRVLYDQLPLLLIAASGFEMALLLFSSWLIVPVLFTYGGWTLLPINWQFWIVLMLYLPALLVLFLPDLSGFFRRYILGRTTN